MERGTQDEGQSVPISTWWAAVSDRHGVAHWVCEVLVLLAVSWAPLVLWDKVGSGEWGLLLRDALHRVDLGSRCSTELEEWWGGPRSWRSVVPGASCLLRPYLCLLLLVFRLVKVSKLCQKGLRLPLCPGFWSWYQLRTGWVQGRSLTPLCRNWGSSLSAGPLQVGMHTCVFLLWMPSGDRPLIRRWLLPYMFCNLLGALVPARTWCQVAVCNC